MPEQRTDQLTGRTVLIAENRALRPNEFSEPASGELASDGVSLSKSVGGRTVATSCPFCPGNESQTPPAYYEQLDAAGHWCIRIIPNKYPAVMSAVATAGTRQPDHPSGGALPDAGSPSGGARPLVAPSSESSDFLNAVPPVGTHEVIIESARHIDRTSALTVVELRDVFAAYADRLRHHLQAGKLAYGLVFKNQGPRAGASIAHLHSQLIALPTVPPAIDAELHRAKDAFIKSPSCAYCKLLRQEREEAARIIVDRDGYVAFCPFASIQPHEVWLLPTEHASSFEQSSTDALHRLAGVLHAVVSRLESMVPAASFNMLLRTAPWSASCDKWFHWRIELLPRVNSIAGLEIATGIYINPLAPERAAEQLRPM